MATKISFWASGLWHCVATWSGYQCFEGTCWVHVKGISTVTGDRWFMTTSQISSMGRKVNLRLDELIINSIEFERNGCWRIGSRLKCHKGGHGPQDRKTQRVRRYC